MINPDCIDTCIVLIFAEGDILRNFTIYYGACFQDDREAGQGSLDAQQRRKETACRTIRQYNKEPISDEDMKKLQEIAEDYRKVKNYVYARYGGIGSLSKLYPGYTVQNEMTASGFRAELGMPSVYFYRAVFDALADIKSQWAKTKTEVSGLVSKNDNLTAEDKHYLRFLLKNPNAFDAALNQKPVQLPQEIQTKYEELRQCVDAERLHKYLGRQIRKYHTRKLHSEGAEGFSVTERAYRYGEEKRGREEVSTSGRHGIFIATKENRKRVFIPLTDENAYNQQIYIKLKPEENGVEIHVPIEIKVKTHGDYTKEVGLSLGMQQMFTTHEGRIYGERFGALHQELTDYMSAAAAAYRREKGNNAGRKKYQAKKAKLDAKIESYVNHEINRLLEQEKPRILYLPKLPGNSVAGYNKKINYSVGVWKKGLIRARLQQKCLEHSVEIAEVFGKGISSQCSECGAAGKYSGEIFCCTACGYQADKKVNAARNAIIRGSIQGDH